MKLLILTLLLFQFGCMTTGANISSNAKLKYNCTKIFVQEKVKFSQASKWCSDNFRTNVKVED